MYFIQIKKKSHLNPISGKFHFKYFKYLQKKFQFFLFNKILYYL
jgi:hypothetical protein